MNQAAQSDIQVQLEFTPNPDTLKYAVNRTIVPAGAANFLSVEATEGRSLLAKELFSAPDVTAVMLGRDFVTVTLKSQDRLHDVNQKVVEILQTFLASDQPTVFAQPKTESANLSDIERKIIEILDTEVRPAVAQDGGDISFEKFEDGFVYLRMQGSCAGCPSSMMTLKMGVETRLKDAIPEVQEVIPV